jgi:hypothetical protein
MGKRLEKVLYDKYFVRRTRRQNAAETLVKFNPEF